MKKKIAYLSSLYPAISCTFIYQEIQELRKYLSVEVFSVNSFTPWEAISKAELAEASNTKCLKSNAFLFLLTLILHPIQSLISLVSAHRCLKKINLKTIAYWAESLVLHRMLEKRNIQHVHVHFANNAAYIALFLSFFKNMSYSLSVHGPDIFLHKEHNNLVEKMQQATWLRVISHYCLKQVMECDSRLKEKCTLVRCGLQIKDQKIEKDSEKHIFLNVGRLVLQKDHLCLLKAVKMLKERKGIKAFEVIIIGGGPEQAKLEQFVKENELSSDVKLLGAQGQKVVQDWMTRAQSFVLTSRHEGLPYVLMEAGLKKMNVIATDINAISELIVHQETGLILKAGQVEKVAEYMELLMLQDTNYHSALYGKVSDEFNVQKSVALMKEQFELIL